MLWFTQTSMWFLCTVRTLCITGCPQLLYWFLAMPAHAAHIRAAPFLWWKFRELGCRCWRASGPGCNKQQPGDTARILPSLYTHGLAGKEKFTCSSHLARITLWGTVSSIALLREGPVECEQYFPCVTPEELVPHLRDISVRFRADFLCLLVLTK